MAPTKSSENSKELKWERVKRYYEAVYRDPITKVFIRFRNRLSDKEIDFLYEQMMKLAESEYWHKERMAMRR